MYLNLDMLIKNMIHVEYQKANNYPHDRELLLFDRNAFQSLGDEGLRKVNERYNVLCPQVFVMECLSPNRASEAQKRWILNRLRLIENPIVFSGAIHRSNIPEIPLDFHYFTLLTSEEIAGNCIANIPITMKRVEPDELISHYKPKVHHFKDNISSTTKACDAGEGTLTPKQINSAVQQILQEILERPVSTQEVKNVLKQDKQTYVRPELNYCAGRTLLEIESKTLDQHIEMFEKVLRLIGIYANTLRRENTCSKPLTIENYPHLAYPIYIYFLFNYMLYARQIKAEHLDRSYLSDFRYLHYLNFCDMFIADETSTPNIVESIPYDNIRETPVITVEELKNRLN